MYRYNQEMNNQEISKPTLVGLEAKAKGTVKHKEARY